MSYLFHSEAAAELDEAFRYYENDYPGRGHRFLEKIEECALRICQYPNLGTEELPNIRRMVVDRFPYKLLYMIHRNEIVILAVAHCRRMPNYWMDRAQSS
ncbi:MAG: type II toxin-antitoxin system RelE/ParE family toxin [Planctomycetota bacterium]|nr:MAG: type II toxin-antitoxin system RelE/ParE family toxin [Planctomycetota bacterium]